MDIFDLQSYDYDLPSELIAQNPCTDGGKSRLLICTNNQDGLNLIDGNFDNFIDQINDNYVIFFNNSKVIKSRLKLNNVQIQKPNGEKQILEKGEIFYLKKIDEYSFDALVNPGKKFKIGTQIFIDDYIFEVIAVSHDGRIIKSNKTDFLDFFEKNGQLPLPPYIQYQQEKEKFYQPIFAQNPGSLASPTACLHFNEDMISQIKNKGININYASLHIGLGTFKLVDQQDIRNYDIHRETVEINQSIFSQIAHYKSQNKKILAVGTTVTRTLESLPYLWQKIFKNGNDFDEQTNIFWNSMKLQNKDFIFNEKVMANKICFETKLFIYPGYHINVIDEVITNFHLPKSSLLMIVGAIMGFDDMQKTYLHAINQKYKFFSFGDAMRIRDFISL